MKNLEQTENEIQVIHPDKKLRLRIEEWFKIPFSIIWVIGIYYIFTNIFKNGFEPKLLFLIVGLIMFIGGIYVTIGRFILKYIEINNSEYVITDSRIIFRNKFWKKEISLRYDELKKITKKNYNTCYGYIIFGEPEPILGNRGVNYSGDEYIFENIKNVDDIMNTIKIIKKEFEERSRTHNNG